MREALAPLRLPGFARLTAAYTIDDVGNWFAAIALPLLVYERTGSALAATSLFLALEFLPALTGPPLVARLEVLGTKAMLPLIYAIDAVGYLVLAAVATFAPLEVILVLAALDGTIAFCARNLTRAASASILKPAGLLREGNAILNMGFTFAFAGGPILAGALIALTSTGTVLYINAASFAFAALLLVGRSIPSVRAEPQRLLDRLREGVAYVRERVVLRRLLVAQALAMVFFTMATPVELVFIKETLSGSDFDYGLLVGVWGGGTILGGIVFAAARSLSLALLLAVSTALIGIAFLGLAVSPGIAAALVAAGIGGLGNGAQWVAVMSAVQSLTGVDFQARIVSLFDSVSSLAPGLGFLAGGVLVSAISARVAFLVAGFGVLFVLAVAIAFLRGASLEDSGPTEPIPGKAPS